MKRLFAIFLTVFALLPLAAQNSITVEAPNVVSMDETFRIVFTGNDRMSDFHWNGSSDFDIVWGPQTGSMSSTTIVNGKRTSSHQETVTYLLQPKSEGTFTLEGATAKVGNDNCTSKNFTIEVVRSQSASRQSQPAQQGTASQSNNDPSTESSVSGEDIFLKLTLSKTNVVKGEPITARLKIYTRTDIGGFEDVHFPTFNGFWSKETVTVQNLEFGRENVNGVIYNSALLREYMLIPQQSGTLKIDPAEMVCQIRVRSTPNSMRSIFDDFFDSYQTIRKRIATPEIAITVKELPSGAPSSFAGGVGSFTVSASVDKKEIKSNEAANLTVTVSGTGNISMLESPEVELPSDFEVYDIKVSDKIAQNGTSGSKSFEYPFIPRSHGEYTIEPIEYSFYDISKGQYVTVKTDPIVLNIGKGEEIEGGGSIVQGVARQGVKNLAEDIRYIATGDGNLKEKGKFFAGSWKFYILFLLIILLYAATIKLLETGDARRADIAGTKNRKANKMARARLKVAGDYMVKGLRTAYYEELHKAVLGYVSDKLIIPMADLSKEKISGTLSEGNVSEDTISSLLSLLDKCEFARYAPDNAPGEMEQGFNEAVRIISQIEGEMKNKKSGKIAKNALIMAFMICISTFASAQNDAQAMWNSGNEAFSKGEWQSALEFYRNIENSGLQSSKLYYNIGNTFFKMGETGQAILYFERALKLDPSNQDAKNNLSIASQMVLDKIEDVPDFFIATWTHSLRDSMSADGWAVLTLLLAVIIAALLIAVRRTSSEGVRKSCFIISCILCIIIICTFLFSISNKTAVTNQENAIVTSPVSSVKSSPAEGGTSIFVLHEGTKVEILDNLGEWTKIELADGRQGWISAGTITII